MSHKLDLLAVEAEDAAHHAAAQFEGAFRDRVEHRLHIGWRAANDLEDIGGRRLPLERLLGLVEQTHVLNRDDRLVGKSAHQLDLVVAERPDLLTKQGEHPQGLLVAK